MITRLTVPGAVPDVSEIRVLEWHGAEGTAFGLGDMVVELETHKAVIEVRAAAAAILRRILCPAGTWGAVGASLALLSDTPHEPLPDADDGLDDQLVTFEVL